MKGKIDTEGMLSIERKDKTKRQWCPYDSSEYTSRCGDYCPLFGEPYLCVDVTGKIAIQLCRRRILFDELEDQREEPSHEDIPVSIK